MRQPMLSFAVFPSAAPDRASSTLIRHDPHWPAPTSRFLHGYLTSPTVFQGNMTNFGTRRTKKNKPPDRPLWARTHLNPSSALDARHQRRNGPTSNPPPRSSHLGGPAQRGRRGFARARSHKVAWSRRASRLRPPPIFITTPLTALTIGGLCHWAASRRLPARPHTSTSRLKLVSVFGACRPPPRGSIGRPCLVIWLHPRFSSLAACLPLRFLKRCVCSHAQLSKARASSVFGYGWFFGLLHYTPYCCHCTIVPLMLFSSSLGALQEAAAVFGLGTLFIGST